jgi:uncharacterized membrane protein
VTGIIVANLLGSTLLNIWENILAKIPLVRTIYSSVKQILTSILSTGSHSFRKVLLIEYPRKGIWTVGFQTGQAATAIQKHINKKSIMVFIPTTPNPTSGFIIAVPVEETRELDMDIETALKLVMSLGIANNDKVPVDSADTSP